MVRLRERKTRDQFMTHPNSRGGRLACMLEDVLTRVLCLNDALLKRYAPRPLAIELVPQHHPFNTVNVPGAGRQANSRFLTKCYHVLAALLAAKRSKIGAVGLALAA
jgi:hypothetical protein